MCWMTVHSEWDPNNHQCEQIHVIFSSYNSDLLCYQTLHYQLETKYTYTVYANCQGRALAKLLSQNEEFSSQYQLVPIDQVQNLSSSDIDKLADEIIPNVVKRLIEKKMRGKEVPSDYEQKQKLYQKVVRFLLSKGHRFGDFSNELNHIFKKQF